jgi:hypothetical protein
MPNPTTPVRKPPGAKIGEGASSRAKLRPVQSSVTVAASDLERTGSAANDAARSTNGPTDE